jgi:hypothetical protein
MTRRSFIKPYATAAHRYRAERNHAWLSTHVAPLSLPRIINSRPLELEFEWVDGRYAEPRDLVMLADHLGAAHGAAWSRSLRHARLSTPCLASDGHSIPGFLGPREAALRRRFRDGHITTLRDLHDALGLARKAVSRPTTFYKDTNPRNILITRGGHPVTLDTDDLSLAPFGYDLAKLVVTLSMTYGCLPELWISQALNAYNSAAAVHHHGVGGTTMRILLEYAELHGILTAPYLGRGGYRRPWVPTVSTSRVEVPRLTARRQQCP